MNRMRQKCRGQRRVAWTAGLLICVVIATPACEQFEEPELDLERLYGYTSAPLAVLLSAAWVNGRVNYPLIARDYAEYIDRFVELCAEDGPNSQPNVYFETRHRAAYYVNVHNGLILQTWMKHGAASGDTDLRFDPAWLDEQIHSVDGEMVSIREVAELAMQQGYQFMPFALASGTVTGPPVPASPLDAETFDRALDRQVRLFFADARTIGRVPDPDGIGQTFYAPPVLAEHGERFGSLEALLDLYIPEGYPYKLDLLRAAHEQTLRFREPSDRINLPDAVLEPLP
ncbi:MAG: hypothetical protein AAGJ38_03405 [Planctomycetota bacterium]